MKQILYSRNIRRNLKNSALFFIPSLLTLFINLFSTPIFAKHLSPYDYSVMGYFGAFQQFFMPIMNMSLFPYYMTGYHKRTLEENGIVLNNLIVFLAIANLGVISAGLIGLYLYFKLAQVMFPSLPYALFSLFTPYFTIFFAALTMDYKMQKRGWAYALVRMIYPILSIGIGLIFVIIMKWGAIGRMGAILIGEMIMGLYAFHTLFNKGFRFDSSIIKSALILGL